MPFSRRKFLRAGTLVAISAGIPLKTFAAETLLQPSSLLPTNNNTNGLFLNREAFSRNVGTKFSLSGGDAKPVAVKLINVDDLTPRDARQSAAATGRECFSAIFIGPLSLPLRQETYTVAHDSLGKFSMLVVPVARNKEGMYYEALFNRLH